MSRIYIAAAYPRREEMAKIAGKLEQMGHTVTSRWLLGNNEYVDEQQAPRDFNHKCAMMDMEDIRVSDTMLSFTEATDAPLSHKRGGRHVEFGLAMSWGHRLIVVGPMETIFHWLDHVKVYATLTEALIELAPKAK